MNVATDYFIKQHGYKVIFVESSLPPNKHLKQTFEYLSKNFGTFNSIIILLILDCVHAKLK